MDENRIYYILQETNHFQVLHETEQQQENVFEEAKANAETDLFEDSEGEYEP